MDLAVLSRSRTPSFLENNRAAADAPCLANVFADFGPLLWGKLPVGLALLRVIDIVL